LRHPAPPAIAASPRVVGAIAVAVAIAAATALSGCDAEDPRGAAPATPPTAPTPSPAGTTPNGMNDPNQRGPRTSTLGRSLDAAERTRDRIQERDAEVGEMADQVFD